MWPVQSRSSTSLTMGQYPANWSKAPKRKKSNVMCVRIWSDSASRGKALYCWKVLNWKTLINTQDWFFEGILCIFSSVFLSTPLIYWLGKPFLPGIQRVWLPWRPIQLRPSITSCNWIKDMLQEGRKGMGFWVESWFSDFTLKVSYMKWYNEVKGSKRKDKK